MSHTVKALQASVDADTTLRTAIRRVACVDGRGAPPIKVVYGLESPEERGHGYYFRWLGRWKSAPGSYQASTRRVVVGHRWLAEYLRADRSEQAADAAVERIESRARGHLRRFLAGWTRDRERAQRAALKGPRYTLQGMREAAERLRCIPASTAPIAIDPCTREVISLRPSWLGYGAYRLDGGRRIESPRLRSIQSVIDAAGRDPSADGCEAAERTLDAHRGRVRESDVTLLEDMLLAQEDRRRERVQHWTHWVSIARTEEALARYVADAERYAVTTDDYDRLDVAIADGRRNIAAQTIREVA